MKEKKRSAQLAKGFKIIDCMFVSHDSDKKQKSMNTKIKINKIINKINVLLWNALFAPEKMDKTG